MESPLPVIALILPAYNEALTIAATMEAFHRALPGMRIIVVDKDYRIQDRYEPGQPEFVKE